MVSYSEWLISPSEPQRDPCAACHSKTTSFCLLGSVYKLTGHRQDPRQRSFPSSRGLMLMKGACSILDVITTAQRGCGYLTEQQKDAPKGE